MSGGTIYVGGNFIYIGETLRKYLAAINTNGTLTAWSPSANGQFNDIAVSGNVVYASKVSQRSAVRRGTISLQ